MLGVAGSSLTLVKFEPTTPNMSQHVTTGWPTKARNMLHPTMLQYDVKYIRNGSDFIFSGFSFSSITAVQI